MIKLTSMRLRGLLVHVWIQIITSTSTFIFRSIFCGCSVFLVGLMHCSRDPQTSFFNKNFIKNGSHGTINTFKNYFAIKFSVFSKISDIRTHPQFEVSIPLILGLMGECLCKREKQRWGKLQQGFQAQLVLYISLTLSPFENIKLKLKTSQRHSSHFWSQHCNFRINITRPLQFFSCVLTKESFKSLSVRFPSHSTKRILKGKTKHSLSFFPFVFLFLTRVRESLVGCGGVWASLETYETIAPFFFPNDQARSTGSDNILCILLSA